MQFDYFYPEESENYVFYRTPNVDSVLGCTSPVRELKIDPDGLVTYVYTGSSDEHTHQLIQPPKPLSATLQAKYTTVSRNGIIKLTAAAGSKSGYTYRFSIKNNTTGKSAYLTDFQKSSNYWWNTGSVGSKTITVEVKDSTGSVGRKSLNINVVNFTAKISAQKTTNTGSGLPIRCALIQVDAIIGNTFCNFLIFSVLSIYRINSSYIS